MIWELVDAPLQKKACYTLSLKVSLLSDPHVREIDLGTTLKE